MLYADVRSNLLTSSTSSFFLSRPVTGFDDEYYMGAKASACKVVWNLALKYVAATQHQELIASGLIYDVIY